MIYKILKTFNIHGIFRVLKKNNITILCLHRVSDEVDFFFNPIKIKNFCNFLTYLNKHYEIIHFKDIKNSYSLKNKLILSFDDGYYDFYENVLPVLVKKNIKANHNIVNICANANSIIWTQKLNVIFNFYYSKLNIQSLENDFEKINIEKTNYLSWSEKYYQCFKFLLNIDFVNRTQKIDYIINLKSIQTDSVKMMNWNQINECSKNNIEIGSHSYSHDNFSLINNVSQLDAEIKNSMTEINNKLSINCNIFSLPNGQFNEITFNYLKVLKTEFILKVEDTLSHEPPVYNRLYLIDEPIDNMICRTEMLQQTIKRIIKK